MSDLILGSYPNIEVSMKYLLSLHIISCMIYGNMSFHISLDITTYCAMYSIKTMLPFSLPKFKEENPNLIINNDDKKIRK